MSVMKLLAQSRFRVLLLVSLCVEMLLATPPPPDNLERAIVAFCSKATRFKPLSYSIFEGRSALRKLSEQDYQSSKSKKYNAIWLLLNGHYDAAHEVILGVKSSNMDDAEHAATHREESKWNEPLSEEDDWIHSLIHRAVEGSAVGEGKHTGWENACYWAAGGPKQNSELTNPHEELVQAAHRTSLYTELVPGFGRSHEIIAGDGKTRTVIVAPGCWDPIAFIRLHSREHQLSGSHRIELEILRQAELKMLLQNSLRKES